MESIYLMTVGARGAPPAPTELLITSLAVVFAALIALSGLIIAKKPEAKHLFEKVAPFQGFIGVGLLAWGIWQLIDTVGDWGDALKAPGVLKVFAITIITLVISAIINGFCLGFGLIATWIPGEGAAEKKGLEIQRKLLTYSMPIGIIGLIAGILGLYYYFTWPPG
jgi:hypothetical protein